MDGISRSLGLDEWSHDPEFFRKLDDAYRKDLRPFIHYDGSYDVSASAAWRSYCFELAQIFSERFSSWRSVGHFRELSESYTGCFNPVITTSYLEDLVKLWTPVHTALLEANHNEFIDAAMVVDMGISSIGDPLVRTVHRLWSGLQACHTILRRHTRPWASRSRAVIP